MIDIHTHILPECDDGAQDYETAINELRKMVASGVTDVVATPHFFIEKGHSEFERINKIFSNFNDSVKKEKIHINLHLAGEIYLYSEITRNSYDLPAINKSKYILVETSMSVTADELYKYGYELLNQGYRPILAHPERYKITIRNPEFAEDLVYRNFYLQINAGSVIGAYGKEIEKTVWNIVKKGNAHFLASDTHCTAHNYYLPQAFEKIVQVMGKEYAEKLVQDNPQSVLLNRKIDYHNHVTNVPEKKTIWEKVTNMLKKNQLD